MRRHLAICEQQFRNVESNKLMKDDGDINQSAKAKALREPPDILLTTPKSLEGRM